MTNLNTLNVDATLLDFAPLGTALQVEITKPIPLPIISTTANSTNDASPSLSVSNKVPEVSQTPKLPHIRQSEALNLFNRTRLDNYKICEFTGNSIIRNVTTTGTLTITIKPLETIEPLSNPSVIPLSTRPSMHRLFRVIMFKFTEQGSKSRLIELSLADYVKLCGLKDIKEARKQLENDLTLLSRISLEYKEKKETNKSWSPSFNDTPICEYPPVIKNSIISFRLHDDFYKYLSSSQCFPMPIFDWVFKINMRHKPHAYYVVNKVLELANMNSGKSNANITSVKTLVEVCPLLSRNKRRFWQSIKEPFAKTIEDLANYGIELEYCNKSGEPLTKRQLNKLESENKIKMSEDEYLNLHIIYNFTIEDYPTREEKKRRSKPKKKFHKQPKHKKLGG